MRKFFWRIVICLVPMLISLYVVGATFWNYFQGRGGFKLGVDLVGGTILIYEVDLDKLNGKLPENWNPQEVARRLKSRIDPGDLYNITIRVASNTRFEIILPTGGFYQREAQQKTWQQVVQGVEDFNNGEYKLVKYEVPEGRTIELLAAVNAQYPDEPVAALDELIKSDYTEKGKGKTDAEKKQLWDALVDKVAREYPPRHYEVAPGRDRDLAAQILHQHPRANLNRVQQLIALLEQDPAAPEAEVLAQLKEEKPADSTPRKRGRRGISMTTEQVQERKELIASQGSLEFVILANNQNDKEAMDTAMAFFRKVKDAPELKKYLEELAVQGKAPPITVDSNGRPEDQLFDTSQGRFRYRWIEMGRLFRWENGFANPREMLGMAVDANVLIYERLREERERNATVGQSLHNGYEHAFPTIIDTHLSCIFTAIVLYVVGNDQLKGFGISLTVGLVISLFTSLYMTRVLFDIWLAKGWLRQLSMANFKHWPGLRTILGRDINFMAIRYPVFVATAVITLLGGALFIYRLDRGGLNIDFMGGIAYSAELTKSLSLEELRELLKKTDLTGLTVEQTFIAAPGYTGRNARGEVTSRLFTVLAETPRDVKNVDDYLKKVQSQIIQALKTDEGELLKTINLSEYQLMPDHREAYLSFVDPRTRQPVFASRAQVSMVLDKELKKQHLEALAQQVGVIGLGKENEGRYPWMKLTFPVAVKETELPRLEKALQGIQHEFRDNPQPERLEKFDSQLAVDTQLRALAAIAASWCAILIYLWFRFGNWTFGLAAICCLIHDLFFTLGAIAASHYFYEWFPGAATLPIFQIKDFKIDLPALAALLTLVGYSVNNAIVVFDRIREVRGRNPNLTPEIINDAINHTLSRTILTSLSVFLVVVVLYYFGGEGVHLFAFVMVVGVIIGTLSSIYVASPLLLLFGEGKTTTPERTIPPQPAKIGA